MKRFNLAKATGYGAFTPPHFILNLSFSLFLVLVSCMGELRAQRRLDLTQYELTWSDEFSYPSKTEMFNPSTFNNNKAKWRSSPHEDPIQWNTDGTPAGTYTPDAISLVTKIENGQPNGYVELTPSWYQNSFQVVDNSGIPRAVNRKSAGLAAVYDGDYLCDMNAPSNPNPNWDLGGFHYGIFEIRAKLPNTPATYAAFWLWGPYYDCTDWGGVGRCGQIGTPYNFCRDLGGVCSNMEIDVFETSRRQATENSRFDYFATIQANFNSNTPSEQCSPCATWYNWNGSNPWETYHTYTVAWTPTSMTWYLDGVEIRTQNGNIPPWRLKLYLTNINYGWGDNNLDALSVDYIRVYRPKLPTTGTPLVNYTYHPASALRSYEPGTRSFDNPEAPLPVNYVAPGPKEVVYRNTWANNPHNTTQGYGAMKKVVYTSTVNANYIIKDAVFYKPTSSALQTYTLDEGGNIIRIIEPSGGYGGLTAPTREFFTNLTSQYTNLSLNKTAGELYWVSNSGNLMVRKLGNALSTLPTRLNSTASADNAYTLAYAPAYGGIAERIYFTSSSGFSFYEKSGTTWIKRGATNAPIGGEFVVRAAAPGYRIFFVTGDGEIRQVTTMPSSNLNSWQHTSLVGTNSPLDFDCVGNLALTSDGKRMFYKSFNALGEYIVKYWDVSTITTSVNRNETSIEDLNEYSDIRARNLSVDRYEVLYVSKSGNVKTYYDRLCGSYPNGTKINDRLITSLQTFSENAPGTSLSPNPADCQTCGDALPNIFLYDSGAPMVMTQRANLLSYQANQFPLPYKPIAFHYWETNLQSVSPPNDLAKCNVFDNPFGVEALTNQSGVDTNTEVVSPVEGELQVYPNPSDGLIYTAIATDGECEITVIDQLGKVVYRNQSNSNISKHDLSGLPQGLYFVRLQQGSSHFTKTFLLR